MRILPTALAVAVLGTAAFTGTAHADAYSASLDACQAAISDKLGLATTPASYDVQKIKSKARFRDISYRVSAHDAANPMQGVKVSCRAKQNGEILAVEVDAASLPNAVANTN